MIPVNGSPEAQSETTNAKLEIQTEENAPSIKKDSASHQSNWPRAIAPFRNFTTSVQNAFETHWAYARYTFWLLWVCRIPLLSAVAGWVLFTWTAPAQDMFLEIRNGVWRPGDFVSFKVPIEIYSGYLYWAIFHLILLYFWALVVHFWSIWIIDQVETSPKLKLSDAEAVRDSAYGRNLRTWLPIVLPAICFLAVLRGEWLALQNLHEVPTLKSVDSLSEYSRFHILLLLQTTWVVLVLLLIFRIRVRVFHGGIGWRLLSIVLAGLAVAAVTWWSAVWLLEGESATAILKASVIYRSKFAQWLTENPVGLYVLLFAPTLMVVGFALVMSVIFWIAFVLTKKRPDGHWNFWIVQIPLSFVFVALLVLPSSWFPDLYLERALLAPLLLGAWVPVLTYFSLWSHRVRAPVILLTAMVLLGLGFLIGDGHDVRRIQQATAWQAERPTMTEAIEHWRRANGCEGRACDHRPIVVAAAGGASRAGFFTASVLGEVTDQEANFRNRLFAISSVSGSTLGAVNYLSAVEDTRGRPEAPCSNEPLVSSGVPSDATKAKSLWFQAAIEMRLRSETEARPHKPNWRECMQILLSWDFLSPVFVSLMFKDLLSLQWIHGDRATALETAWSDHYARAFSSSKKAPKEGGPSGLERPFLSLAPDRQAWRPILIANGASGATGRRVLTSHVEIETKHFNDAYDVFKLFEDGRPGALLNRAWTFLRLQVSGVIGPPPNKGDLPLSTVATMSARFPYVSPHGNVRNRNGKIVDRVIDGGYFENYGAITASEVVQALRAAGLNPFVLMISNEPTLNQFLPCIGTRAHRPPQSSNSAEGGLGLAALTTPIEGVLFSRPARGRLAAVKLCQDMAGARPLDTVNQQDNFALVRVFPDQPLAQRGARDPSVPQRPTKGSSEDRCKALGPADMPETTTKDLSVSWWLSKPAQQYLDCQLHFKSNKAAMGKVIEAVRQ